MAYRLDRLFCLAGCAALGLTAAAQAVELDPKAVAVKTPDQFVWRDPTDKVTTNNTVLHGDPNKRDFTSTSTSSSPGASAIRTISPTTASSP